MKIVKPSFQIIEPTGYTIDDIYKSIELVGRVSHKSESSIKEGSAKTFVNRIINWGHNSCLEFGTIYLHISVKDPCFGKISSKYSLNEYSIVTRSNTDAFISSNYRVLVENNWLDDLKYLCEPTEEHIKRYCVKFVCSRSISHEFVRHRKFSFMQESQRYCNYNSNKFNNSITFIMPHWFKDDNDLMWAFIENLEAAEKCYLNLVASGFKAEDAREVLPNATKTELYMCGFSDDWEDFLRNRSNKYGKGGAHPSASELADSLYEEFIKRGYIK